MINFDLNYTTLEEEVKTMTEEAVERGVQKANVGEIIRKAFAKHHIDIDALDFDREDVKMLIDKLADVIQHSFVSGFKQRRMSIDIDDLVKLNDKDLVSHIKDLYKDIQSTMKAGAQAVKDKNSDLKKELDKEARVLNEEFVKAMTISDTRNLKLPKKTAETLREYYDILLGEKNDKLKDSSKNVAIVNTKAMDATFTDQAKHLQKLKYNITMQMEAIADSAEDAEEQIGTVVKSVDEYQDAIGKAAEKLEDVAQKDKVTIFDGVSEQVFDVTKDIDALMAKLDEMAKKLQTPAWHTGDLRAETVNSPEFKFGDSFAVNMKKQGTSAGSGHYFSYNLPDVLEWMQTNKSYGDRGLFTLDLNDYNLLKMPSDDYYLELKDLFGAMHKLITNEAGLGEYNLKKLGTPDAIFQEYKKYFSDFSISYEQFVKFVSQEVSRLKNLDPGQSLDDMVAIQNRFMSTFVGAQGIDASLTAFEDSVPTGSVIYPESFNKSHPYAINWGGNTELAKKFFDKIVKEQLKKKAANPENYIEDLIMGLIPAEASSKEWLKENEDLMKELEAIQEESKKRSFQEINAEVFKKIKDTAVKKPAQQTVKEIKNEGKKEAKAVKEAVKESREMINEAFADQGDSSNVKPTVSQATDAIKQEIEEQVVEVEEAAEEIGKGIVDGIAEGVEQASRDEGQIINSLISRLKKDFPQLYEDDILMDIMDMGGVSEESEDKIFRDLTETYKNRFGQMAEEIQEDSPALSGFAKRVSEDIEQAKATIKSAMDDLNSWADPEGIIGRYLLGKDGLKGVKQLGSELADEITNTWQNYTDADSAKASMEETFRKWYAARMLGMIDYDTDIVGGKPLFNEWSKSENEWQDAFHGLGDDAFSLYRILIDSQEHLNAMQRNGGQDYIEYLEKAKALLEEIDDAKERNSSFSDVDVRSLDITQDEADSRAAALQEEARALDDLIARTDEYMKAHKEFTDIEGSPLNWRTENDIKGLETMSTMFGKQADQYRNYTRFKNIDQSVKFSDLFDEMFDDTQAPRELEKVYSQLYDDVGRGMKTCAEATEELNNKAKELGFTFNEVNKKWETISFTEELKEVGNQGEIAAEEITEGIEKEKNLYDQIYERIEKIRMLGAVGGAKSDIAENLSQESKNLEAFKMQMEAIKTLTPTGEMNPEIRDLVLNPALSIEEITNTLVQAANDYAVCKKALDDLFAKAGITGGKVYDDAYRNLSLYSHNSEGMFDVVAEIKRKIAMMQQEDQGREERKQKVEAETKAQEELKQELVQTGEQGEAATKKIDEGLQDTISDVQQLEAEMDTLNKKIKSICDNPEYLALYNRFSTGEKLIEGKDYTQEEKAKYFNYFDQLDYARERIKAIETILQQLRSDKIVSQLEKALETTEIWYRRIHDVNEILQDTGGFFANSIKLAASYFKASDKNEQLIAAALDTTDVLTLDANGKEWNNLYDITVPLEDKVRAKGIDPLSFQSEKGNVWRGNTKYIAQLARELGYLGVEIKNIVDVGAYGDDRNMLGDIIQVFDTSAVKQVKNITDAYKGLSDEIQNVQEISQVKFNLPTIAFGENPDFTGYTDDEIRVYEKLVKATVNENGERVLGLAKQAIILSDQMQGEMHKAFINEFPQLFSDLRIGKLSPDDFLGKYEETIRRYSSMLNQTSTLSDEKVIQEQNSFQSELDESNSKLKEAEESVESYQNKVKELNATIEQQTQEIEDLNRAKQQIIDETTIDAEHDSAIIMDLEAEVHNLEQIYNQTNEELELQKQKTAELEKQNELLEQQRDEAQRDAESGWGAAENRAEQQWLAEDNLDKAQKELELEAQKTEELKRQLEFKEAQFQKAQEAADNGEREIENLQKENHLLEEQIAELKSKAEAPAETMDVDTVTKLQEELEELKAKYADLEKINKTAGRASKAGEQETKGFKDLATAIEAVVAAVEAKTKAFKEEKDAVKEVVKSEVNDIDDLKGAVDAVQEARKKKKQVKKQNENDKEAERIRKVLKYYSELEKSEKRYQFLVAKVNAGYDLTPNEADTLRQLQSIRDAEEDRLKTLRKITDEVNQARNAYRDIVAERKQSAQMTARDTLVGDISDWVNKIQDKIFSGKYSAESTNVVRERLAGITKNDFANEQDLEVLKNYLQLLKEMDGQFEKIGNETKLRKLLLDINKEMADNSKMSKELKSNFADLGATVEKAIKTGASQEEVAKLSRRFLELKNEMVKTGQTGKSFAKMIINDISQASARMIAQYMSFQDWVRYIRQAVSAVTELNSALNQLKIVSGENDGTLNALADDAYQLANKLGISTTEVVSSITEWRRLGKSIDESMILAEQAARLSTGGLMDINSATTALVSSMQAFEMGAEEASRIVDQYIYLGKQLPIDNYIG